MFNFFKRKDEKKYSELEKKEKMFRTLLDAAPLCIKWFDKRGNLISINRGGREEHFLEDKTEEEIKKWDYFGCIEKKYHETIKDAMKLALNGQSSNFEMEHVPNTSKGHWCSSSLEPVKNENGDTEYVLFLSRDITDEKTKELEQQNYLKKIEETKNALYNLLEDSKESEKKAKEESERSGAIISSMGESLLLLDKDFKVVLLNNKAENLLGVLAENVIGQKIENLLTTWKGDTLLDAKDMPVARMFKMGQAIYANIEDDFYFQISSGKKFPVGFAITPLEKSEETSAVIIFWDLTEEKNLDKAKNSFISVASHQLRTPLTSLRWISELFLSGDIGKLEGKQLEFMKDLYKGSVRLLDIIGVLLAISRLEAGRVNIEVESTDVGIITQEIINQLKPLINQKKLAVKFAQLKSVPKINLAAEFLRQAILNLISNAINYTPKNGHIDISIKTVSSGGKKQALFSIKDTGIGIPKDAQKRIFEKFYRADNAIEVIPSGTGLGLNLVQSIVKIWDGEVWFESTEKGTTFFFTIPLTGMRSKKGEVKLFA